MLRRVLETDANQRAGRAAVGDEGCRHRPYLCCEFAMADAVLAMDYRGAIRGGARMDLQRFGKVHFTASRP